MLGLSTLTLADLVTTSSPSGRSDRHSSSAPTPFTLVIGVDAGGTSSRALLAGFAGAGLAGGSLGRGTAPAGNPASRPVEEAVASVTDAIRTALGTHDPATVRQVVIGVAGGSRFDDPEVRAAFARGWTALGLHCPVEVVGDNVVAFAAGTPAPDGHVLVSGTGAIAAEIAGHALLRMSGGLGWLLGDEGSAFWIGREAARLAVAAYDDQRPMTPLDLSVATAVLGSGAAARDTTARSALVAAIYGQPPTTLARLAPLVSRLAEDGDEEAVRIVREAAALLADTLARIRPPDARSPIVLAGSCVSGSPLLAATLRAQLVDRWDAPIALGLDGAAGAAWLAAHRVAAGTRARGTQPLTQLHTLLVAGRTPGTDAGRATGVVG